MRLVALTVVRSAALSDLRVNLAPGLTVVEGPNEAGKSTLFRTLDHLLLTPSKLGKREFESRIAQLVPRPGGDFVEARLDFVKGGGEYSLTKRWGADPLSILQTPDGTVRGADEVESALAGLLPQGAGTMRKVFLTGQNTLSTPVDETEARSIQADLGDHLRRAVYETGGVSIDDFFSRLDDELGALSSKWDQAEDRPQPRGPGAGRWARGHGSLVTAYYDVEDALIRLEEARETARRIGEVQASLTAAVSRRDTAAAFVDAHRAAFEAGLERSEISGGLATGEQKLTGLRDVARRLPVLDHVLEETRQQMEGAQARLQATQERLALFDRGLVAAASLAEADRARTRFEEAGERLSALPAISPDDARRLGTLDRELGRLDAVLTTGSIRARVRAKVDSRLTTRSDRGEPREAAAAAGAELEIQGHRRIAIETDELSIEVDTGDQDLDELASRRDAVARELSDLAARLGTADAGEAAAGAERHAAALRAREEAEQALVHGDRTELLIAVEAALAAAGEGPGTARERIEAARLRAQESREAAQAEAYRLRAEGDAASREREALVERYGDMDAVEEAVGRVRLELARLTERRKALPPLPEGTEDEEAFRRRFLEAESTRASASDETHELRRELDRLESQLPEEDIADLETAVDEARKQLSRLKRRAGALARVRQIAEDLLGEMDRDTYTPYLAHLASFVSDFSGGAYRSEGEILPRRLLRLAPASGASVELPLALLSEGTRGSLGMAVRLALAESYLEGLPDGEGFMVLDDPLVDLDPQRRAMAVRALESFASRRQVVILTCHPDHAGAFSAASRIHLPGTTPSAGAGP